MCPARNRQNQPRLSFKLDCVARLFCADVHLEFKKDFFFSCGHAARDLMNTGNLSWRDFEELRFHMLAGYDGLDCFRDVVNREPQSIRNHRDRFRQTMMLDNAGGDLRLKFFGRHSRSDFLLQRKSPVRRVHNSYRSCGIHLLRRRCERQDQLIHHETRIDAGADERDAFLFCGVIEFRRNFRMLVKRIG